MNLQNYVLNRSGILAAGLCLAVLVPLGTSHVEAQTVGVAAITSVRLVTEPSGAREDNNGGLGNLTMGINTGGVDNFALLGLDPVGLSVLGGLNLGGDARLVVPVNVNFSNGNHGTAADTFHLYELPSTNTGWLEGVRAIGGPDRPADDGSATFLSFAQYNDNPGPSSGTTIPWMDESGSPVANILEALPAPIASVPGWAQGSAPSLLEIPIPLATLEGWTTSGVAGLVLVVEDDGDSRSRFVLFDGGGVLVNQVPEPSTAVASVIGLVACGIFCRRQKS